MAELIKTNVNQLFLHSSYSMFNLIGFLEIILINIGNQLKESNNSQKAVGITNIFFKSIKKLIIFFLKKFIEQVKIAVQGASRQCKDQVGLSGRGQVFKVFLFKLTYILKFHISTQKVKVLILTYINKCNHFLSYAASTNVISNLFDNDVEMEREEESWPNDPNDEEINFSFFS